MELEAKLREKISKTLSTCLTAIIHIEAKDVEAATNLCLDPLVNAALAAVGTTSNIPNLSKPLPTPETAPIAKRQKSNPTKSRNWSGVLEAAKAFPDGATFTQLADEAEKHNCPWLDDPQQRRGLAPIISSYVRYGKLVKWRDLLWAPEHYEKAQKKTRVTPIRA